VHDPLVSGEVLDQLLQAIPIEFVAQAIVALRDADLRNDGPPVELDSHEAQPDSLKSLLDFEIAGCADRGLEVLPLAQAFREPCARADVKLQPFFFAQLLDFSASATPALDAEDAVHLGEFGRAFVADETVGKDDGAFRAGGLRKFRPVEGIRCLDNIDVKSDLPEEGLDREGLEKDVEMQLTGTSFHTPY